jgi:AraC family transcriptional regulator of adaptative response / DNA-3-methyladenine glycosylase II
VRRFPTPAALAAAPDGALPMPAARARALRALAAADPPLERPGDAAALLALPGIGPWTAGYVALRLGDPDVFLGGDVAVRRGLARLGLSVHHAPAWRPFRSSAVLYLWGVLTEGAT